MRRIKLLLVIASVSAAFGGSARAGIRGPGKTPPSRDGRARAAHDPRRAGEK